MRLSWQFPALISLFEEAVEAKNTASIPDVVKMLKLRGTDGIIKTILVMTLYSVEHLLHSGRPQLQAYTAYLVLQTLRW